ncbi:helix-turn-helix transcriptional regulator [Streptomyces sp. NPDC047108]|uniref:helix-turn-helix transcriptional regulator n=1 Tax=Streptomyces sp. NPDC047108 TaxID=3155025 RepID=UPI00340A5F9B
MATEGKHKAELAAASLARQATTSLAGLLAARGVSRSELAKLMGVSPGRVSQMMSGDANLTVRSLASAAAALGASVEIRFFDPPPPPMPAPHGELGSGDATRCGSVTARL